MAFIQQWSRLTWLMLTESALLLIFGFVLAGIIRAVLTPKIIRRIFGKGKLAQVFSSSVVGIPLPLCSCSVLPVAAQLRRSGLSREGTISFLISTPETGVDSIALSYRLLGPVFTIARPVAAFFTAIISGTVNYFIGGHDIQPIAQSAADDVHEKQSRLLMRLRDGQIYILKDFLPEMSLYLFWGFILAGVAAALIPADLLRGGFPLWLQYLAAIVVSLPVYVCATSSTPLAAVFFALGINPGAVLTFLLVGPATNLTALVVQKQILGLKSTVIMTVSIVVSALICGLMIDYFLKGLVISPFDTGLDAELHDAAAWYDLLAALAMAAVMIYYTGRHYYRKIKRILAS